MAGEEQRVGAGERLARLETKIEAVERALDRGSEGFEKIRTSLDGLTKLVAETHAACVKPADLREQSERIDNLETFRDRVKRYSGIAAAGGATVLGSLTLFGPERVAQAFRKLWE